MGPFNNREIAISLWLFIFLVWVLPKVDIRKPLAAALRAFFHVKVFVPVCLMMLYTAATVMLLAVFGLWNVSLIKDTIMWFCVSAMALMMHFVTSDDVENIFQKVLTDNIKIILVLEFLVNTYTFSLPVELVLVPVLTLIAMVDVVAGYDKKHSAVAKAAKGAQTIAGFVILAIVVRRAITDLQTLHSLDTVRNIALAPLLTLLFSPFLYLMVLISKYEHAFLRLRFDMEKEKSLKRYAQRRIVMHAGLSIGKLHRLLRNHAVDLMNIRTKADVDHLMVQAKGS